MVTRSFGRYEVREEIGDGAMGRVYRGFDPLVRRPVAIKTVKSEYLTKDTRDEYLRRFRREAQAAGRLSHANIVSIFDVGEDYFVMEYVEGITVQDLLRYRGVLELDDALRLLAPVADALDYAHRTGVIHRDIKPSNIMVQPDGRPKLMDFGVAHLETSAMTASGQFFGSPSYMAPEQILDAEVTHRADLFSFAVVAYEATTGRRPFQGESITAIIYRVVNESPPPPRSWNLDLPPSYDEVFARALAKPPAERYANAMAFVSALTGRDAEVSLASLLPEPVPEALVSMLPAAEVETQDINRLPGARLARWARWAIPAAAILALTTEIAVLGRGPRPQAAAEAPAASPAPPALTIETEPEGASVWLNGAEMGAAPVALRELPPGPHQVRVERKGYAPAELGFEVSPGTTPPPLRFVMSPLSAPLEVETEPYPAEVRLDGTPVGHTPLKEFLVSPGTHEVRIDYQGFLPNVQKIEVQPGKPLRVQARLEPAKRAAVGSVFVPDVIPIRTGPMPIPFLQEGMLVPLAEVDVPPRKISGEDPRLPAEFARLRVKVAVLLNMIVTEKGEAKELHVLEGSSAVLEEAVIEAVQRWRFEPARKQGVKVKVRIERKFTFERTS